MCSWELKERERLGQFLRENEFRRTSFSVFYHLILLDHLFGLLYEMLCNKERSRANSLISTNNIYQLETCDI